jgi:hypothetical protein
MTVNSHGSNSSKSSHGVYKIAPSLLNPTSPAPAPHSAPQSPSSHAALHRLHSPPRCAAAPNRIVPALHSPPCHTAAPHCITPALHSPPRCAAAPPSPLPNMPNSSWSILEDPSTTIFDTVALFPMMTMAMEMVMVVPTRSRLQPVHWRPLLPPEGALRRALLAPTMVLLVPPRGRGR